MSSCNLTGEEPKKRASANKSHGGWWFLLAVLLVHLGMWQIAPGLSAESLGYFLQVMSRLLPVFGLLFLLLWLFNLFARPKQIKHWLGGQSGSRGWIFSILGGVASMGSMYLWYPLLHDLKAHGMRSSLLAAFLYSRAVKIPMLPLMVHYFGTLYTGLYVVNILLFSVLSGVIMERLERGTPQGLDDND